MDEPIKMCEAPWCEKPLERKEDEVSTNYRKRRYCNRVCSARHSNYLRK